MNPYESLCYFDKRNPNGDPLPDDDDPREPRELGCACDNCFYGRDAMALEIIQLRNPCVRNFRDAWNATQRRSCR